MQEQLIKRAKELLADGTVQKVVGWQKGLFDEDVTPAVFASAEELDKGFVFNKYCAANLSKYLVKITREIFLRNAYLFSLSQMILIHLQSCLKKTALPAMMFMQSGFLVRIHLTAVLFVLTVQTKSL